MGLIRPVDKETYTRARINPGRRPGFWKRLKEGGRRESASKGKDAKK